MIARIWHGCTKPEHADGYESHLKPELLPGLGQKKGFRGSYLLRRPAGDEVEFITIILWDGCHVHQRTGDRVNVPDLMVDPRTEPSISGIHAVGAFRKNRQRTRVF
jgi:hypothetical protein